MRMSTFTALNGGSPKATEAVNGSGAEAKRTGSEERRTDAPPPPTPAAAKVIEPPTPANDASPGSVRERERQREQEREREQDRERERERERDRERGETWRARSDRSPPQSTASYREGDGSSHKRKRTHSPDPKREREPLPRLNVAEQEERSRSGSHDTPSPEEEYRDRDQDRRYPQSATRDDWGANYEQAHSAIPNSAISEVDPMGDALSRSNRQPPSPNEYGADSPDGDDQMSGYAGRYTPEQRRDGVVQSDPKRRKRNFSNRTKTGCLTCRRRKKKCDEAKPECSNCMRGGFVCAGYLPQRGNWPKPEVKPTTVQIESKDPSYVPPGAYGMPAATSPYGSQSVSSPQKREPLPAYRGQQLRIEPPQGRLLSDDDRATASTIPSASVTGGDKLSALSALSAFPNTAANAFPTPVSAAPIPFPSERKDYPQRVPPLHDLSRTDAPDTVSRGGPQKPNTLPQINILHATGVAAMTPNSAVPPSGVQATAQMALSHTFSSPSSASAGRQRRVKDDMLAGRPFLPFDKELVLERERCSTAVWRFNNATNPNNGVSPPERSRLFREILQPREGVQITPTQTSLVTHAGRVGDNVVVEAPFHCDYGYNIKIGANVVVGRNCTINDAAEVVIGDNVIISPNVSFYTSSVSTDPRFRPGSRAMHTAKPIVIEDNVWIGAGTIIITNPRNENGLTIGAGTTVGAGSVVTKSLPARYICYGNPCHPKRGPISFADDRRA